MNLWGGKDKKDIPERKTGVGTERKRWMQRAAGKLQELWEKELEERGQQSIMRKEDGGKQCWRVIEWLQFQLPELGMSLFYSISLCTRYEYSQPVRVTLNAFPPVTVEPAAWLQSNLEERDVEGN